MITNSKGQTSIEALLAIPLMVSFIFMVFVLFTSIRSFFWAQYQLHEAIVCLQDQTRSACTRELKHKMKKYLTFWNMKDAKLTHGASFSSGKMILSSVILKNMSFEIVKRVQNE